jgi:hypothetical protein
MMVVVLMLMLMMRCESYIGACAARWQSNDNVLFARFGWICVSLRALSLCKGITKRFQSKIRMKRRGWMTIPRTKRFLSKIEERPSVLFVNANALVEAVCRCITATASTTTTCTCSTTVLVVATAIDLPQPVIALRSVHG